MPIPQLLSICSIFIIGLVWATSKKDKIILGTDNHRVVSYLNRHTHKPSYYHNLFTGLEFECVEFARRWLITVKGYTFPPIESAFQIFDLSSVQSIHGYPDAEFSSIYPSNTTNIEIGDLLIFKKSEQYPHGHVSVVCDIDASNIYISEQNYSRNKWASYYSRKIAKSDLSSMDLLGWKRIIV